MTRTLEQAIERLRQISAERQDLLARLVLFELDEDQRWMQSTDSNVDKLRALADDVLEADRRGECEPLDPDRL